MLCGLLVFHSLQFDVIQSGWLDKRGGQDGSKVHSVGVGKEVMCGSGWREVMCGSGEGGYVWEWGGRLCVGVGGGGRRRRKERGKGSREVKEQR